MDPELAEGEHKSEIERHPEAAEPPKDLCWPDVIPRSIATRDPKGLLRPAARGSQ
jgi:hypothetical protein